MAKFNVNTGVGQFSPGQQAAIDKVVRQPVPPVDDTVADTPVEQLDLNDPLVYELTSDYGDLQTQPAVVPPTEPEAEPEAPFTPEQLQDLEPEDQYQRQTEQRKPIMKRIAEYKSVADQKADPFTGIRSRANAVRQTLEADTESAGRGLFAAVGPKETEQVVQDPTVDPQADRERATAGWQPFKVLADSSGFDAGIIDTSGGGGVLRVNPLFADIGTIAVEASLSSDKAFNDTDYKQDEFKADTDPLLLEEEGTDGDGEERARGNERIGRAVYQEWMREKAVQDGQESDYYLLTKPEPEKQTMEYVGGLLKEAYFESLGGQGNPYLQRNTTWNEQKGRNETLFQPTADGLRTMRESQAALGKPFEGNEIAPRATPAKEGTAGQQQFEGRTYTRKKVSNLAPQPHGKKLNTMEEAMDNLSAMASHVDLRAEGLMYQNGIVATNQAIAYYKEQVSQLPAPTDPAWEADPETELFPVAQPSAPEGQADLANWWNVGSKQLQKQVGKKRALFVDYQLAQKKADKIDGESKQVMQEKADAAYDAFKQFDPGLVYRGELNKFIEDLNTISRYGNRQNYNTYQIQMGQGRMNMQQNRYNPQSRKNIRFATRMDHKGVSIHPRATSGFAYNNFAEVTASMLFDAGKLHTDGRIQTFRDHVNNRSPEYTNFVKMGNELIGQQLTPDQVATSREILQGTALVQEGEGKLLRMDPRFQQVTVPTYSDKLQEELGKHKAEEVPYIMELLMDVAKFDEAHRNNTYFTTKFEPEMDGIANGLSSFGLSLGSRDLALRGGVMHIGDKKLMVENQVQGNVRKRMGELMQTHKGRLLDTGGFKEADHEALSQIADLAIDDETNYLKPPPMTFGYGQELDSLKEHVKNTIYSGVNSNEIAGLMSDLEPEDVEVYLHQLLQETLVEALGTDTINTTRQLRNNNLLAVLTGIPLHHDNAMGFRNWIGGKESVGKVGETELKFREPGTTKRPVERDVPHYETEFRAAAKRQRGLGRAQAGGWGHGQVIPGIIQSYDGNMIAQTASGRSHAKMKEVANARGHTHAWLPIFDAAKTNLANMDLVRDEMNRNWFEGIRDTNFVEQMMGPDGWADQVLAETNRTLSALDPEEDVPINEGQFQGISDLLFDEEMLTNYLTSVLPAPKDRVTNPKGLRDHAKDRVESLYASLKQKGIDTQEVHDTLKPKQIRDLIDTFVQYTELKAQNRALSSRVKSKREELWKEINPRKISQVDLG